MNGSCSKIFKASSVAAAVAATLGTHSAPVDASTYKFSYTGFFTMLSSSGAVFENTDLPCPTSMQLNGRCERTSISGVISYDDVAGTGTIDTMLPFSFFGGGRATASGALIGMTINAIGNGAGGAGNLLLGNMLFNWNTTYYIPVSLVWDATGLLGPSCLGQAGGLEPGESCSGVGSLAASEGIQGGAFPMGEAPMAVVTQNTTTIGTGALGTHPSGTTPLIADTVGGSPMTSGPFTGSNANFDILTMVVIEKDGMTLNGPPVVSNQSPAQGEGNIAFNTVVSITFDRPVQAATVAAAGGFTLRDAANNPVPGTVSPSNGSASAFTFTPSDVNLDPAFSGLNFTTGYTATVAATVASAVGDMATLGNPVSWSFTTAGAPPLQFCSGTTSAYVPQGGDSNFTMLTSDGGQNPNVVEDGTNDVTFNLDFVNLNNSVAGTNGVLTNVLASPTPYKGFIWTAHDIRLFAPGAYSINVDCTADQIQAGTCATNPNPARNINFTVGAGQIGAHMLFDWNVTSDIDVVNVWNQNTVYNTLPAGEKNNLHVKGTNAGPPGDQADPNGTWLYASSDVPVDGSGDGANGAPMIDGPFPGFNANFNLGPQSTCTPVPPPVTSAPANSLSKGFFGCSLTDGKVNPWQRADLSLLAGFLGALAFWRRRNRTNA